MRLFFSPEQHSCDAFCFAAFLQYFNGRQGVRHICMAFGFRRGWSRYKDGQEGQWKLVAWGSVTVHDYGYGLVFPSNFGLGKAKAVWLRRQLS